MMPLPRRAASCFSESEDSCGSAAEPVMNVTLTVLAGLAAGAVAGVKEATLAGADGGVAAAGVAAGGGAGAGVSEATLAGAAGGVAAGGGAGGATWATA